MQIRYSLARTINGMSDNVLDTPSAPMLQLQDVTALIRNLLFVVEVTPALKDNATVTRLSLDAAQILTALEG